MQGVFFRDSVRRRAQATGVHGWARNLPDGSVEVVLEGPEPAVAAVVAFCRKGPPQASVESVEVAEESPVGLQGFRIA